jgi:hypothetical protein
MKNAVLWDVAPYKSNVNRVSEERIASIFRVEKSASEEPAWAGGSDTSIYTRSTRRHIPEDDILLSPQAQNTDQNLWTQFATQNIWIYETVSKWRNAGACITRSFTIYTLHQLLLGGLTKEDGNGEAYSTHGRGGLHTTY